MNQTIKSQVQDSMVST